MIYRTFDPWRQMTDIQREMNRLFDLRSNTPRTQYPAVNLWTNADNVLVTAELPGYEKEAVDISLTGDVLRIHGSRTAPECKEEECFHRQERKFGVFDREIQLPFTVNQDKVDAEFSNGILKINLPRAEQDKPKKIKIQTN
jgi:HSP20 family protein